ncbi:hypothetical protein [Paenibacillus tarimensis]|uniref:hypothetical protein n=1 Tax=Paenibacillus tarimensis TaxID=416012 RepID=UPI001F27A59A|nr:hypothetical protein [Paenibacillus tarimensis]MCF2945808.1 hypothetical protein [Paenibacillus tarimensis]
MRTAQRTAAFIGFAILYYIICSVIGLAYLANTRYGGRISLDHYDEVKSWILFIFPLIAIILTTVTLLLLYKPWKKQQETVVD